ncbi:Sodium/hydrogen exchanger family-domain-containing protein [Paraphoma chrysanthemicola]|uniref:Sodium/hydrogen exchanger family-domain-containing protein n=1 Tax=Paraphoma chrysanthemicola TaxID=798071 RepID=A0A8K0VZH6_9PLEO|nr:Sodium/hydrogen exchanger family-domain-containing protein [Paraphoma chrysanthemicola]
MAEAASASAPSLPYHEPGIVVILILTSFLLLLNLVNAALDKILYCGLLGQVFIGIAWGTPGAKWLSPSLILLVYEGGLHTSFQALKANLLLSAGVALTGIAVPIGLSYTLQGLLNATPIQAFAAGAALCSTSLGTTFTVLGSSGLSTSRLGVVLTSAAMMDDVVGLVMVQVISNLGGDKFSWVTVVRPVLVSVAFAAVVPLACLLIIRPATLRLNKSREAHPTTKVNSVLQKPMTALVMHSLLLIALITGATYAGTSNLFAAYIAGAGVSWWDSEVPHPKNNQTSSNAAPLERADTRPVPSGPLSEPRSNGSEEIHQSAGGPAQTGKTENSVSSPASEDTCGSAIYTRYYHPAVSTILQPMFFASVGFSIPITRMFAGAIVWRGIVYTVLMALAKLVCGLWLVRFSSQPRPIKDITSQLSKRLRLPSVPHLWGKSERTGMSSEVSASEPGPAATLPAASEPPESSDRRKSSEPSRPVSLHPPMILALAMCARGEIGFLISGVAESNGVFSSGQATDQPSDIFLVVTWAIVLCTIVGPLGVGLSVRRVKTLQERKDKLQEGTGRDVLGVWGIS